MRGDFSRIRFSPQKQYTAVLDLQGRPSVDADGNEQCHIDGYLRKTETVNVIGEYGAPIGDAGFEITVDQNEILIGAGRYYVAGLMCENRRDALAYGSQPYLIGPSPVDATLLNELVQQGGAIQVFLQVWQRLVTALDDPCLREPALGRVDTTARLQTVWRVAAAFVPPAPPPGSVASGQPSAPTGLKASQQLLGARTQALLTAASKVSALTAKKNLKKTLAAPALLSGLTVFETGSTTAAGTSAGAPAAPPDCCTAMYAITPPQSTGTMGAITGQGSTECSCQPIPAAGYQGLENQLYRVEIHQPGDETTATVKWSRENGSVVSAIQNLNGPTIWVDSLGPDANLGFQPNQWVEISDDSYLFGQTPNQQGLLYQILSVDPAGPSITLTAPVVPVDTTSNARVRRWDQSGPIAGSNGVPLAVNSWLTLENGIQVSFSAGSYRAGDYWTIPARTASGQIDWPPCGGDGNTFQPPHSIAIYNAPLAYIHWDAARGAVVESCRRLFSPLTDLTPPATPPAIHITKYNWQNDDVMTFDQLLKSGLALTVDQAPTGPVSGASFVVTVECLGTAFNSFFSQEAAVPAGAGAAGTALSAAGSIYTPVMQTLPLSSFILDWQVTVNVSTMQITWQLPQTNLSGLQFRFITLINDNLLASLAAYGILARARVKLLSAAIFAQSGATQAFLDGQSFGLPATRQDGKTPCVQLQMPSGNGAKASDFEGWFYLAPFNGVGQLTMNYSAFTVVVDIFGGVTGVEAGTPPVAVTPQVTVQLNYPAATTAGVTVSLSLVATTSGVNTSSYVSLATTSLVIQQGASQANVNINVFGNPGQGNTYGFQITASVDLAYGTPATQSVTFTLTGVQGQSIGIGRLPVELKP